MACVFGRKKDETPVIPPVQETLRPGAKNRPTPKRREAEAARRRPLVPEDRKAAARADRQRAREGMAAGEERFLAPRDRGPIRAFQRDIVDARRNIGEMILPIMVLIILVMLIPNATAQLAGLGVAYALLIAGVLDAVLLVKKANKLVREKFRQDPPKGSGMYVAMRAFQMRRLRMPKPRVERGTAVS